MCKSRRARLCALSLALALLTACAPQQAASEPIGPAPAPSVPVEPAPTPEPAAPAPEPAAPAPEPTEEELMPTLHIRIGEQVYEATLNDHAAARALLERLPLSLDMRELNGNEKFYYLPDSLPQDASLPDGIRAGDLMLYGSDCLVLFYRSFSTTYRYTALGCIDDPAGLADAVGTGDVSIAFEAAE